jgi:hypothetical protein
MAAWEHGGGFSVDSGVRIGAHERAGLERLREIDPGHLVYESTKPGPGGNVSLLRTPMQLLDRLAALIPPPRRHRHRYYCVLAPNSPLRVMAGVEPDEIDPQAQPSPDYEIDQPVADKTSRRSSRDGLCLWSRKRQISAVHVVTDTHNGQAGAGFEVFRHKFPV